MLAQRCLAVAFGLSLSCVAVAKDAPKTDPKAQKTETKKPETKADDPEKITAKCAFDISIGGTPAGTVVIGVFGNTVPKTAENFMEICRGAKTDKNPKKLSYSGNVFHRIIPGFMLQGGDITRGNGTGGESIYGEKFADENFTLKHLAPGYLSMANAGPNTNGSQFFITTITTTWLDGKHVVFGKVIDDKSMELVKKMEAKGSESGKTSAVVKIEKSYEKK